MLFVLYFGFGFGNDVVCDISSDFICRAQIEVLVQEMIDWILKRNAKQWANVIETIQVPPLTPPHPLLTLS